MNKDEMIREAMKGIELSLTMEKTQGKNIMLFINILKVMVSGMILSLRVHF